MTSYATTTNETSSPHSTALGSTATTGETHSHQHHQYYQQPDLQQETVIVPLTTNNSDSNTDGITIATSASTSNLTTETTTKLATGIDFTAMQQDQEQHHHHRNLHHHSHPTIIEHQDLCECDCDSLSDGREKADTTPENIKKFDDIIEFELELERTKRQQQSNNSSTVNDGSTVAIAIAVAVAANENESSDIVDQRDVGFSVGHAATINESNEKFCFVKNPKPTPAPALCTGEEARLMVSDNNPATLSSSASKTKDSHNLKSPNRSSSDTTTTAAESSTQDHAGGSKKSSSFRIQEGSEETDGDNDNSSGKRSCAFTFTFDNNDANAAAATAARYKTVMERFQSRHRRGASMSKLDSEGLENSNGSVGTNADGLSLSSSASASPSTVRSAAKTSHRTSHSVNVNENTKENITTKVKLRPRDRSTSRVRDAAKRHSWSPRSSTSELSAAPPLTQSPPQHQQRPPTTVRRSNTSSKPKQTLRPIVVSKGVGSLLASRSQQFKPRSTAMQLALQKMDLLCPHEPLRDFEHADGEGDDVSEAGTYTLDGDNYTEEQKDLMNIDKNARNARKQHKHLRTPISPTSPNRTHEGDEVIGSGAVVTKIPVRTSNVLEVNYFHNEADDPSNEEYYSSSRMQPTTVNKQGDFILGNHQSAGAYLENLKSRVLRNTTSSPPIAAAPVATVQSPSNDEDIGCFTSVTTSGVLATKGALDPRPKLSRKSSLTTSQIDSSEYVSNEVKLKSAPSATASGSYTDIQKAEYRLNLFTNQKDLHKYAATRNLIETPPETPIATTDKLPSDTAALTMAQSKNDWIQQWARNARARSLATDTACGGNTSKLQQQQQNANVMTRSYNCGSAGISSGGGGDGSLTDESLYSHQLNSRYCMIGPSDNVFDYSSDPSLLTSVPYAKAHEQDGNGSVSVKPPKSPSKIPSPLHSIGRTRSASRTRGSLQGLLNAHEDEDGQDTYLQKTAAAINSLQQSLSRRNSIKSPTGSNSSPRMNATRNQLALQGNEDGDSPQRSIESDGYQTQRHRRNFSNDSYVEASATGQHAQQAQLMTSSFNEQQLKLLTSGDYLIKQMRMRKNSFDGNTCSPRRRIERPTPPDLTTLSPLHRGGSFSMKMANTGTGARGTAGQPRSARPQYQNIYTPPAARQGYVPMLTMGGKNSQQQSQSQQMAQILMRKSASSNNFGQAYSDYDDNLEYYINDADDDDVSGTELNLTDEADLDYGNYCYGDAGEEYGPRTITLQAAAIDDTPALAPLTSTRYNKALLMRIERSKQRAAAAGGAGSGNVNSKPTSAPITTKNALSNVAGVIACPNTPELPRRHVKSAPRSGHATARQSVPRDTSLSRLASQVPNSLASAKKQLLQTAAAGVPLTARSASGQRVQPKYMDISKYKPAQGNAFLRKDESKSTLKALDNSIRRSPSSSGLSRADPTRASNRSQRSAMTSSCTGAIGGGSSSGSISGNVSRASSAVRRDDSVNKQKEIEMAMWKRRSTYDPLKAAAEDRRRKEEAKRLAMAKNNNEVLCESKTSEDQ